MAVTYTYGSMQNRIADELGGRTDLLTPSTGMTTAPIPLAIQDAIKFYDNERFYFNEYRTAGAFTTVLGQEFYTSSDWADIATITHIDKMSILISGNRFWMWGKTAQELEDISMNTSWVGQPVLYSYYNEQIRLYPIPDNAYPVNVLATKTFAELVNSSDTNPWVNDAEAMIRGRAKYYLFRDTLQDVASAAIAAKAADEEYKSLKGETFKRGATWRTKATQF